MENKLLFEKTFQKKLIYIFRINDKTHSGLLKIGDTTITSDLPSDKLFPNCAELNKAAKLRIDNYTRTAGINYELLHTELAIREEIIENKKELKSFRDKQVHKILINSGIKNVKVRNTTGTEWFKIDLNTAKNAINAVKNNQISLNPEQITQGQNPIIFRPEQEEAIKKTIKNLKISNRMLWNAKMRFGKTICALEVIRQMGFQKTLIISHRPVVNNGWHKDFNKIFKAEDKTEYIDKGIKFDIKEKIKKNEKFIYFMSIQDLRGSQVVDGKFDKNDEIFETQWDFIIVDEAHEGTTTERGKNVTELLTTIEHTKILELSGTPFNIMDKYEQNDVYTWDYMMEQKAKTQWDIEHFGDSNPYEELPQMKIFTYDLGESLGVKEYEEIEDKAFNFKEFFRTWTLKDNNKPANVKFGNFVHEKDVKSFLNLITNSNDCNNYPYSCEEYRNLFKHSLWMLPGVKEARALSAILKQHPVFGSGQFEIVNIAGDGDEEDDTTEALTKVTSAIRNALENDTYTITLSCGKLTTGVTIPEWTAVMMLSGSYSTSAANYLQTIFRVQSSANIKGMAKKYCYVFDFAPDRTLKMVADAVKLSTKAGKTTDNDRKLMGEFLNFCPIISYSGTQMIKYDETKLLQQLKRAYAERALKSGFDDVNLYNDELLKLNDVELEKFEKLKKIIGSTKTLPKIKDIDINKQGLTNEEYEQLEKLNKKPKKELTQEEKIYLEQLKQQKQQRQKAISILRAISIRIPLLIYGADINNDIVQIQDLLKDDVIDENSWAEFMPKDIDKNMFKEFIKYYDIDVFNEASQKIRKIVKYADTLPPTQRAVEIARLFSYFKNPDKETVLTPWRVVNMHLGDCLGGYNFYDEKYEREIDIEHETLRYIEQSEVTKETLSNKNAQILEINSKTGLYPLYVTYSIFRSKCPDIENTPVEEQRKFWNDTVQNNIYVICKTPMAKLITKRTLVGFNDIKINARYFEDLINTIKHKPKQFIEKIKKSSYWSKKDKKEMKFDAVVGNPPYQENIGNQKGNSSLSKQLFPAFIKNSILINSKYLSLVTPSRWFTADAQDKSFIKLREFIKENNHFIKIFNYPNNKLLFKNVEIAGGVNYFLYNNEYNGNTEFIECKTDGRNNVTRPLFEDNLDIIISMNEMVTILDKIRSKNEFVSLTTITFGRNAFGIVGKTNELKKIATECYFDKAIEIRCAYEKICYTKRNNITKNIKLLDKWKIFTSKGNGGAGLLGDNKPVAILGKTYIGQPQSACTDSLIPIGCFDTELEAKNMRKYMYSKFLRFIVGILKVSQNVYQNVYQFVPMQDFTKNSDINWEMTIPEIDKQLYKKYELNTEEINYIESKIKPME